MINQPVLDEFKNRVKHDFEQIIYTSSAFFSKEELEDIFNTQLNKLSYNG